MNRVIERYSVTLRSVLNNQMWMLGIFVATFIITALLFYIIPKGFFPVQDTGVIQGTSEAAQSISFPAMSTKQQALAKVVLSDPAVDNLSSFIGVDGSNTTLNSGRMLITLKPLSERDASASEVIQRLQSTLKETVGARLYMQPVQDLTIDTRVSRTQYQLSIGSPDAAEVATWTTRLFEKMQYLPELLDVASDQQNEGLQTLVDIDRDTAARLGITPQMIDNTLYDAFGQRQVSTMFTQRNQSHVILEALPHLQTGPDALKNIYFESTVTNNDKVTNHGMVPLTAFATIKNQIGPLVINRQGQFPVATISFNLAPNISLGKAVNAINTLKQALSIPDSVQIDFEGSAKIFQNSLANQGWLVLAAIVVVYIVLGVLYESYIHPLTILSTLPSAGMGALLALFITRNDLTVIALIGIILLIGIVMKNAIMMIDFALEQERLYKKSAREAIYEAALLRFRPILMTTMASLLGAVPLAFGHGMGAELRQPLGITIIGGLIVSQLLTLYSTPVIYLLFDRIYQRFLSPQLLPEPILLTDQGQ